MSGFGQSLVPGLQERVCNSLSEFSPDPVRQVPSLSPFKDDRWRQPEVRELDHTASKKQSQDLDSGSLVQASAA